MYQRLTENCGLHATKTWEKSNFRQTVKASLENMENLGFSLIEQS